MKDNYRIRESVDGKFKAQKLTVFTPTICGFQLGRSRRKWIDIRGARDEPYPRRYSNIWDSHAEAEKCMFERIEKDIKLAENNGNEWGSVRNKPKERVMDTNYEKTMSLKKEYEDLKKQLESIKKRMLNVKQKAKDELNWIMSDGIEK